MPDFQEFIATLDSETISSIMGDGRNAMDLVAKNSTVHQESIPALQILNASYLISLDLLGHYHKWLEQYL